MVTQASMLPYTLNEYALLADGERGALVGPRGDIGLLCAPRWHDEAVLATALPDDGFVRPFRQNKGPLHEAEGSVRALRLLPRTDQPRSGAADPGGPVVR